MKKDLTGFTLIELMVVISIIGILSTITITTLNNTRQKARDTERKAELRAISRGLEMYFSAHGQYPAEGVCDSSRGTCATACPCPGSNWTYSGSYIGNVLRNEGYFSGGMPLDPLNDSTYYYNYEPNCSQGTCPSSCCNYTLTCRLEGGGSFTISSEQ